MTPMWLSELNGPQRDAVTHGEGPLLVVAGAGSGKTRVITRRISHLIAQGLPAWQITAITFTNRAAREMRERVQALAGDCGAWLSTFHALGARVLRRHAEALGYPRDYSIYDEDDVARVIKAIYKELHLDDKAIAPAAVRQAISKAKNRGERAESFVSDGHFERAVAEVFERYEAALVQARAFDFDDLLLQTLRLFVEHEAILETWQRRARFLLVDEFQDTNRVQYRLVRLLSAASQNVTATGDPDQSIYSWRGADPGVMADFLTDHPDARRVTLDQNYRSRPAVLRLANALIAHNPSRLEKNLWSEREAGPAPELWRCQDDQAEARLLARRIEDLIAQEGRAASDFAVFYRQNAQSRLLEASLRDAGIPYQLVGQVAFYQRAEVKDALSYARLLLNPNDDQALLRSINTPARGVGAKSLETLARAARQRGRSLFGTLADGEFLAGLGNRARNALMGYLKLFEGWRNLAGLPASAVIGAILDDTGMVEKLSKSRDERDADRVENLQELRNAAFEFDQGLARGAAAASDQDARAPDAPFAAVAAFLEQCALHANVDEWAAEVPRVTLMTLHQAKGLEFAVVFITGLEDGLLPHYRALDEGRGQDEERRLFYVGLTRAKDRVLLSRCKMRGSQGYSRPQKDSRFLKELPRAELEERRFPEWADAFDEEDEDDGGDDGALFGARSRPSREAGRRPGRRERSAPVDFDDEAVEIPLEEGQHVYHQTFGLGVVTSISGPALGRKVCVRFQEHGERTLMAAYAKLLPVSESERRTLEAAE